MVFVDVNYKATFEEAQGSNMVLFPVSGYSHGLAVATRGKGYFCCCFLDQMFYVQRDHNHGLLRTGSHDGNLTFTQVLSSVDDEVLLYVHRNCRLIRDGSPGRPPRLSHSS